MEIRHRQEIESATKKEADQLAKETKSKDKAQQVILQDLKQEKNRLEDTIYRLKRWACIDAYYWSCDPMFIV